MPNTTPAVISNSLKVTPCNTAQRRYLDALEALIRAYRQSKDLVAKLDGEMAYTKKRKAPEGSRRVDRDVAISAMEALYAWQFRTGIFLPTKTFFHVLNDCIEYGEQQDGTS